MATGKTVGSLAGSHKQYLIVQVRVLEDNTVRLQILAPGHEAKSNGFGYEMDILMPERVVNIIQAVMK